MTADRRLERRHVDPAGATYRGAPGEPGTYVVLLIDRDRYDALGGPGWLDVAITVPEEGR